MNLLKLKQALASKGIIVSAGSNSVIAGLVWGVDGIEKVKGLGDVLFYTVNGVSYGVKPSRGNKHDIQWYYDQLKTGMKGAKGFSAGLTQYLNTWVKKGELNIVFKGKAKACAEFKKGVVTADLFEGEDIEVEVNAFIDDVNSLTLNGKKVFKAEKKGNDIVIKLEIKKFDINNAMDNITRASEDELGIIFPITERWMMHDKGQTFGNMKKVGDLTMYTSEWSSQEFSDELYIDWNCSKVDPEDIVNELNSLYNVLKNDVDTLSRLNGFKVVACVSKEKVLEEVKKRDWKESDYDLDLLLKFVKEQGNKNLDDILDKFENMEATADAEELKVKDNEHDRLMFIKIDKDSFFNMCGIAKNLRKDAKQIFKRAVATIYRKFKDVKVEYFFNKTVSDGYVRVELDGNLYIIHQNANGEIVTTKMKRNIPSKNFNFLSVGMESMVAKAVLPAGMKKVWTN